MNKRIESPINLIEATDSYKVSHWLQYEPGTQRVFSFFESRGGVFPDVTFFGLQYYLKRYLLGQVITAADIDEAGEDFNLHFDQEGLLNRTGWERVLHVHGGRLPVRIWAVPEGTTVPTSNVLMAIENLDDELPMLTNYIEGLLSMIWYPSTVTTQSRAMRGILLRYLEETGNPALIDHKLHDFGFRGSTSLESAGIGGMAHLVNFKGTDTLQATRFARHYYHERMAGNSVVAAEHSTITSWGKDRELEAYAHLLNQFPSGILSVVSDSWDIYRACEELWGSKLRDQVLERDGVLVIRPDSGDPATVVVKVLEILGKTFGFTTNTKDYKVLNDRVRVIQGDGIEFGTLGIILQAMKEAGWSADNLTFGSGGGLLQKVNRDTQKFAFKCSAVQIDDTWRDVMKDPITDPGKRSKAGRLALAQTETGFQTMRYEELEEKGLSNVLVPVFENGELLVDQTFAQVRSTALIA